MKILNIKDFSLKHTIESGQFFTFEKYNDFYYIIHKHIIFKIKQEDNTLFYDNIEENQLIHFFDLNLDLKKATQEFDDEHLLLALEKYWGLRLIKQDLWQCIISFVCSSASNIPKIKKNLKLISEFFGEKKQFENKIYYTFPQQGKIDNYEKLIHAKTGYRAKYIFEINKIVKQNPQILEQIKNADYKHAKKLLMQFPGIGTKVSDCICLFALEHKESFPIDTWIKQILEELYHDKQIKTIKQLEQFIEQYFKSNKGLKQQYLFHYARNNLKNKKN